jgi:hypothetical protein
MSYQRKRVSRIILISWILAFAHRRQLKDLISSSWPWIGQDPATRMFIKLRCVAMDPAVKPRDDEELQETIE